MKKVYSQPRMEVETFAANEYIAACYAIVEPKTNDTNFIIRKSADMTDGVNNRNSSGVCVFNNKGFGDDNYDCLGKYLGESHDGWFYNGPGMEHKTRVQVWESNGDTEAGQTLVEYMATQVFSVQITEENASMYGTTVNAS